MTDETAVVISIDRNYLGPTCTMLRSLAANTTLERIAVRVLHNDLDHESIEILRRQRPDVLDLEAIEVQDLDLVVDAKSHISSATYRKLVAAQACAEFYRLLVLDVDLVVLGDISELVEVDLQGRALGAVRDALNPFLNSPFAFPVSAGREAQLAGRPYFNSGVMVLDVRRWTAARIGERAIEFARDGARVKIWEQDALNGVLIGEWVELDPRWNCFPISELGRHDRVRKMLAAHSTPLRVLRRLEKDAKIIHFVGRDKPWLETYPDSHNRKLYRSF